ncbi:MAG: glycogen synthase [Crocinitomicaceae bacterium]|nr:glycogen synthase [Crocinitomicaceae bacterium]|tara:strand:- start:4433 stop:5257 length:825 start_codon:yes stop_codon:yes gene_type:complete
MEKSKILYVTQEINPFLIQSELSEIVRTLSQGVHEQDKEIRIFMPRFGVINERRHQLHEVIRLSGMNMIVNDYDHPLIIKVASIPQIRIQVYFIDNEEYFKRKQVFNDESGKPFKDNDERSMFFCRGVLETVKKLGWMPDIVHCHGWMTALMPIYLKSVYQNDPHFANSKVIFSVYNNALKGNFPKNFKEKLEFDEIPVQELGLTDKVTTKDLNILGVKWADAITVGSESIQEEIQSEIENSGKSTLEFTTEDNLIIAHQDFYDKVLSENGVLA